MPEQHLIILFHHGSVLVPFPILDSVLDLIVTSQAVLVTSEPKRETITYYLGEWNGTLVDPEWRLPTELAHSSQEYQILEKLGLTEEITMEPIKFYSTTTEYGYLSNFYASPITIGGKKYKTTEHYFQSQKFVGLKREEEIIAARTPSLAATAGRNQSVKLRQDWDTVKNQVMKTALTAKFSQHVDLAERLLATGDAKLIEHTKNDFYWADGGDGSGQNWLGRLLMEVRAELRSKT